LKVEQSLQAETGAAATATNFPNTTINGVDTWDLNKTASHQMFGPYTNFSGDPRDSDGMMHFTKD
jgi:hypothetical protein